MSNFIDYLFIDRFTLTTILMSLVKILHRGDSKNVIRTNRVSIPGKCFNWNVLFVWKKAKNQLRAEINRSSMLDFMDWSRITHRHTNVNRIKDQVWRNHLVCFSTEMA